MHTGTFDTRIGVCARTVCGVRLRACIWVGGWVSEWVSECVLKYLKKRKVTYIIWERVQATIGQV
jgi:hypothetical protein